MQVRSHEAVSAALPTTSIADETPTGKAIVTVGAGFCGTAVAIALVRRAPSGATTIYLGRCMGTTCARGSRRRGPVDRLYCLGPWLRARLGAHAVPELREHAARLAARLSAEHWVSGGGRTG